VGGFAPGDTLQSGVVGFAPALADVNEDGLIDIVWPTETGRVLVWRNRGGGRFEVLRTIDVGAEVVAGAVGDLDGDGKPDLVTASADRSLSVYPALADRPDFVAQLTLVPEKLALADLDGDGRPEICLALLGLQQGEIQVWTDVPGGNGWAPSYRLQPPEGGRGRVLEMVGGPAGGLIVASGEGGEGVLESWGPPADTDSVSVPVCRVRYRVPGEPVRVVAGRFADGVPWVTVVPEGSGAALYGIREGKGLKRVGFLGQEPEAIGVLDLDADGDDDLVTGGRDLRLWINVRGTGFREAGESPYRLDAPVVALVAGNLDERGS
jgi:hypothetical protein